MPVPGMHVLWPKSYSAGSAITAHRAVKRGADEDSAVPATAASVNLGIAQDNQDNVGKPVSVAYVPGERPYWEASAAFAIDTRLASAADGRAVAATSGQSYLAISRQAATAAGQLVVVEIVSAGLVAP